MAYFSHTFHEPITRNRLTVDSGKRTVDEAVKDINRYLRRRYRDPMFRGYLRGIWASTFSIKAEQPVPTATEAAA